MFPRFSPVRLGLALLGLSALSAPASAQSPGFSALPGHIPMAARTAQAVAPLTATQPVALALTLPLHRQAELDDLLRGLSDPADPRYGHFLTPEQFTARYSPTPAEYARVIAYAKSLGLTVTGTHPNRTVLDVSAPAGQVGRAFGLHLMTYSRTDGRTFFAPDAEPQVPSALRGLVSGIVGLSNVSLRQPHLRLPFSALSPALDPLAAGRQTGSGPNGGLSPTDIKTAYNLGGIPANGDGQTLALFELDGYTASDVAAYETAFGLPKIPLQNIFLDGATAAPLTTNGAAEVTLDIELQAALAPGAAKILVYIGPNSGTGGIDTYNKIATDNLAKQISSSWGLDEISTGASERNAENTVFQQMAAQGQTIYAASGDSGAYDNGSSLTVDDPASQPFMAGVGGTALATNGPGGPYKSETTWNNGAGNGAGGGGISTVWNIPSYQSGLAGSAASKGSATKRNVPDVSLDADPNTGYAIYYGGGWTLYGGTSCAAPLWAAFTALVNQRRAAAGSGPLGFANTPLYALAKTGAYAADFHDIADGSTNLFYPAVAGYDNATGLGTFNGAALLADLSGSAAPAGTSVQINSGGGASGTFGADTAVSGGSVYSVSAPIYTGGALAPAPQSVYQSERFGNFTYTVPSLTPGAAYTLRLHFAEIYWTQPGQRLFNVAVNGTPALTNFDILAATGGINRAVVEDVPVTADAGGKVTAVFTTVKDNAKLSGLEVVPAAAAPAASSYHLNAGGGASGSFGADANVSGGSVYRVGTAIDTSGVSSPAPQEVYQSERFGSFVYALPGLTPGRTYTLRLHFAEVYWTSAGQRVFNVTVNGTAALTNFDIVSAAGGANRAVVKSFPVTADAGGRVTVVFTTVKDNAKLSGIELQ